MDYKLLVLDIDGTLTNSKKEITPKTLEALLKLQERGIAVAIASGRPTPGVRMAAEKLELARFGGYTLSFNGGRVRNEKTKEIVMEQTLPADMPGRLYQEALNYGVGMLSYDDEAAIAATEVDQYMEIEARINHIPLKRVENFVEYMTFPTNKCLMTGEPEHLVRVEQELKKKYEGILNIFRSEPYFLELMPLGIDKAETLKRFAPLLGLTREQLVCCGDGFNDITMIAYAGLGVAMENARDEVKKAADFVTGSNDEDGLVTVVEKFFLKE